MVLVYCEKKISEKVQYLPSLKICSRHRSQISKKISLIFVFIRTSFKILTYNFINIVMSQWKNIKFFKQLKYVLHSRFSKNPKRFWFRIVDPPPPQQITLYCIIDYTKTKCSVLNSCLGQNILKIYTFLFPLSINFLIWCMCPFHVSLDSKSIPKYFISFMFSIFKHLQLSATWSRDRGQYAATYFKSRDNEFS